MNVILKTGFQKITHNIDFTTATRGKGQLVYTSNHVKNVEEIPGVGDGKLIRASVVRSTNHGEEAYRVTLEASTSEKKF